MRLENELTSTAHIHWILYFLLGGHLSFMSRESLPNRTLTRQNVLHRMYFSRVRYSSVWDWCSLLLTQVLFTFSHGASKAGRTPTLETAYKGHARAAVLTRVRSTPVSLYLTATTSTDILALFGVIFVREREEKLSKRSVHNWRESSKVTSLGTIFSRSPELKNHFTYGCHAWPIKLQKMYTWFFCLFYFSCCQPVYTRVEIWFDRLFSSRSKRDSEYSVVLLVAKPKFCTFWSLPAPSKNFFQLF